MGSGSSVLRQKLKHAEKTGVLSLADSHLKKVPKRAFSHKLKSLDLSDNELKAIQPSQLKALASGPLRMLNLSKNRLSSLPPELAALSQLETLALDDNALAALPDALGELAALRTLSAARNRLRSLPDRLPPSLTLIDLSGNQLATLPASVARLPALEEVRAASCAIEALPPDWSACRSLRRLLLPSNRLTGPLPASLLRDTPVDRIEVEGNARPREALLDAAAGFAAYEARRVARVDRGLRQGVDPHWGP